MDVVPRVERLPGTLAVRFLNRQPAAGDIWRAGSLERRAAFDRVDVGEGSVVQCSACCTIHEVGVASGGEGELVELQSE